MKPSSSSAATRRRADAVGKRSGSRRNSRSFRSRGTSHAMKRSNKARTMIAARLQRRERRTLWHRGIVKLKISQAAVDLADCQISLLASGSDSSQSSRGQGHHRLPSIVQCLRQSDVYGALEPRTGDHLSLTASTREDSAADKARYEEKSVRIDSLAPRSRRQWQQFVDVLLLLTRDEELGRKLGSNPALAWRRLLADCQTGENRFDRKLSSSVCRLLVRLARLCSNDRRSTCSKFAGDILDTVASARPAVLTSLLRPLLTATSDDFKTEMECGDRDLPEEGRHRSKVNFGVSPSDSLVLDLARVLFAWKPGVLASFMPAIRAVYSLGNESRCRLLVELLSLTVAALGADSRRQLLSLKPDFRPDRPSLMEGVNSAARFYDSVEEYFDTMFRRLHADCFESFRCRIQQIRDGNFDDSRHESLKLRVYSNVKVAKIAYASRGCSVSIGVTFSLVGTQSGGKKKRVNWGSSARLQTGNLVCLSTSWQFSEQIWATVFERNVEELKEQDLVWIELCSSLHQDASEQSDLLLKMLLCSSRSASGMVMLESSTLFRAFEPVLESLQDYETSKFRFTDVFAFGKMRAASEQPRYVRKYYESSRSAPTLPFISTAPKVLDNSQVRAFSNAFRRRISVCQGPPGTGKTLLGVLIAKQLLQLGEPCREGPLLVVCYKNHALDEFLTQLINDYRDCMVRIGGRCNEPRLQAVTMNELRQANEESSRFPLRKLDSAWNTLEQSLKKLDKLFRHPATALLETCNESQLSRIVQSGALPPVKKRTKRAQADDDIPVHIKDIAPEKLRDDIKSHDELYMQFSDCVKSAFPQLLPELLYQAEKIQQFASREAITQADNEDDVDEGSNYEEIMEKKEQQIEVTSTSKKDEDKRRRCIELNFLQHSDLIMDPKMEQISTADTINCLGDRDPAKLGSFEQWLFFQLAWFKAYNKLKASFVQQWEEFSKLSKAKIEADAKWDAKIIREKKIIGITITGASINRKLLDLVKPSVVILEEAAEVGEPQLLASLRPSVEHLILIGDHEQLKPRPENYSLARETHLNVSIMEKLVKCGIRFDQLELQGRMRPEISRLLLDIYPRLRDNRVVVYRELKPNCFSHPLYFWNHNSPEESRPGRHGFVNQEEADRCIQLALFLVVQGIEPSKITVLCAYKRQSSLVRSRLRQALKNDFSALLSRFKGKKKECDDNKKSQAEPQPVHSGWGSKDTACKELETQDELEIVPIQIFTIDFYQGDENDVVIVSLVRSNNKESVGFLNQKNRRCVAQSRARLAMVLVGNASCLSSSKCFFPLIETIKSMDRCGDELPLVCPMHPYIVVLARSASNIPVMDSFCRQPCEIPMSCGKHPCPALCQPAHDQDHSQCKVIVHFNYQECGHDGEKFCHQSEFEVPCKVKVRMKFSDCGHEMMKECGLPVSFYRCQQIMQRHLPCGHFRLEACSADIAAIRCHEPVSFDRPCGHRGMKECCVPINEAEHCKMICRKPLEGCNHPCQMRCWELCEPKLCKQCNRTPDARLEILARKRSEVYEKYRGMCKGSEPTAEPRRRYLSPVVTSEMNEHSEVCTILANIITDRPGWHCKYTIEKVENKKLLREHLQFQASEAVNPIETRRLLYPVDSKEALETLLSCGFSSEISSTGCIYFPEVIAVDSGKRDNNSKRIFLLLCSVATGKLREVETPAQACYGSHNELKVNGWDSLLVPPGVSGDPCQENARKYAVFDARQVLPQYVVHCQAWRL